MNRNKVIKIVTDRLVLVPQGMQFLDTTYQYASDLENTKFMINLPDTDIEETKEFLTYLDQQWNSPDQIYYEYAILLEGSQIGSIGLDFQPGNDKEAEFGWIINKIYGGKGYMKEAAIALRDMAIKQWGLKHFFAHCDSENVGSYSVMEYLGMVRTDCTGGRKNKASEEERMEYTYRLDIE